MNTIALHRPRILAAALNGPGVWQRLWKALEAHGQRRAAAELRRHAWRVQPSDPALARQLLEAAGPAERA